MFQNKKVLFLGFYDENLLCACPYFIPSGIVSCATAVYFAKWNIITYLIEYSEYEVNFENELQNLCEIISDDVEVVCIGGMSVDFLKIRKLIFNLKKIYHNITVIIGGGVVTSNSQFVMKHTQTDFGIVGEGEQSLVMLLDALYNNENYNDLAGLCYKLDDNTVICNDNKDIEQLDSVTFPKYELFPKFAKIIKKSKMYPINLSRSCPYHCTFCFHTSGVTYRTRSIENIMEEIHKVIETFGINHLFIIDELFGADKKQFSLFINEMKKLPDISFNVQTRADLIDETLVSLCKDAGCTNISIGIESADNQILKSMGKGITIEYMEDKLELILSYGLQTNGNIILGDISETYETASKSIDWFLKNYSKYNLNIGHIQIYPGTYLFDYAVETEKIDRESFLLHADNEKDFIVNVSKMNDDEYEIIRRKVNKIRFLTENTKNYLFKN